MRCKNLSYGFLTGILRIAQESIFNGIGKYLQFVIGGGTVKGIKERIARRWILFM